MFGVSQWWQTSMFGVPAVMAKAIRDGSPPPSPSIVIDHNASIMAEGTTRHSCIWRVVCEKFYIKCEIIRCITLTFMQPSGHLKVIWEFQRHVVACSEAQFNIKKILSLLTHVVKVVVTLDVCCFCSDGREQYIKRRLSISTPPSHEWSRYFNVFVSAVGHDGRENYKTLLSRTALRFRECLMCLQWWHKGHYTRSPSLSASMLDQCWGCFCTA